MGKKAVVIIFALIIVIAASAAAFFYYPNISGVLGYSVIDIGNDAPKNVILITLDTVRADHVHHLGYERETTPFLDEFAKKSVVFENAHSSLPLTTPSHTTMLTGLYASEHGVMRNSLGTGKAMLQDILSEKGYHTSAFVSTAILKPTGKGFQQFDYKNDLSYEYDEDERGEDLTLERARKSRRIGRNTLGEFRKWSEAVNSSESHFLWVHFYDAHSPYMSEYKDYFGASMSYDDALACVKKEQAKARIGEPAGGSYLSWDYCQSQIISLYDGGVYTADKYAEAVVKELESKGMLSNSIVIIASDHGENLGERSDYFHGRDVYDATTRVPLIIWYPGVKAKRINEDVSLASITPTILDYLGINNEGTLTGVSLMPLTRGHSDNEFAVVEAQFSGNVKKPAEAAESDLGNNIGENEKQALVKDVDRIVMCSSQDNKCADDSIKGRRVALVRDQRKLIYNGGRSVELYDLKEDPIEAHNIYGVSDSAEEEKLLDAWIALHANREGFIKEAGLVLNASQQADHKTRQALDEEALEALKSLGYMG